MMYFDNRIELDVRISYHTTMIIWVSLIYCTLSNECIYYTGQYSGTFPDNNFTPSFKMRHSNVAANLRSEPKSLRPSPILRSPYSRPRKTSPSMHALIRNSIQR